MVRNHGDPDSDVTPPGDAAAETSVSFSIVVGVPIEQAFRTFTERLDAWWPREHHIGAAPMAAAILERRVGGRWYELGTDGSECDWGIVLAWEPPHHLALSWHLDGDFRTDMDLAAASRVDVRFVANGSLRTTVSLVHSGLDRHGPTWPRLRDAISRGWPSDLLLFARAAEGAVAENRHGAHL